MSLPNAAVEGNELAGQPKGLFHSFKHAIGFWILLAYLIGITSGLYAGRYFYTHKMDEAIKMQRFVYNQTVYDVMVFDNGKVK